MNQTPFDQSLEGFAGATGRRAAVRSLGAIGAALFAALGFADRSTAEKRRTDGDHGGGHTRQHRSKDRRQERNRHWGRTGQQGPQRPAGDETPGAAGGDGPAGPDGGNQPLEQKGAVQAERKRPTKRGPTGPTGPAGSMGATRLVVSPLSDPLPVTAGASVIAVADCGGEGKAVSCGYQMSATAAQLVNAFVAAVGPNDDERADCVVNLRRTTDAGSTAGAQIVARAICLV
jgi:hypothetical protein